MNYVSKPIAENALQGNLVELSRQNGKTHLQIQTLNEMVERLREENAKLRERYYAYEHKMDGLVCKLTGGLLSKSATLPNDALYSVVEEQMTDELVDENFKLGLENAKLREQVTRLQADWESERDYADQMEAKERQAVGENAKLRELCKSMRCALADFNDRVYLAALDETLIGAGFDLQELGIEVE